MRNESDRQEQMICNRLFVHRQGYFNHAIIQHNFLSPRISLSLFSCVSCRLLPIPNGTNSLFPSPPTKSLLFLFLPFLSFSFFMIDLNIIIKQEKCYQYLFLIDYQPEIIKGNSNNNLNLKPQA